MSLTPSLQDAFAVGKLEGEKESIKEVMALLDEGLTPSALKVVLNAKLKVLSTKVTDNPFGVNKSDVGEKT